MSYQAPIAYAQRATPARSLRSIEYELFAQITQRLRTAWTARAQDFPGLVRALADNQQLWSTLAADVATPGNGLPDALRSRLFYLYEFTAHHSRLVQDEKAGIDALVDINTSIMRGLRGDGGAG
ncbi:MAG: flagellar biosynthesis regulator FlhF [Rhodobacterales bacterium 32-66-7]|nr:MAG: flagellar biosynthesis regulator FlhF [Rhodobacterales bacterium 12-65-15]OYX24602.1 MAG: flagellar biosynthesis regulator FlhF [Rhodobacterales bacterium 32-66-7]